MADIKIHWAQPSIGEEELREVQDCFASDWLSMGPKTRSFEEKMAEYMQVPYAIAVNNGTVALDLALQVLSIEPGDEIIVPANTYIATVNAVLFQRAVPVFADIDDYGNLDPDKVDDLITARTKLMLFIDYGGAAADIAGLLDIGERRGISVMQDAAQSLGGIYLGKPLGTQTEISTMSFHTAKIMTTIEGGMIYTHNSEVNDHLRSVRNQGERPGQKYMHPVLGTNARMTDLQAGIGLAQLRQVEGFIQERNKIARKYQDLLGGHGAITLPNRQREDVERHPYFFYAIRIPNRDEVARRLLTEFGVDTRIAYPLPVYKQGLFTDGKYSYRKGDCLVTERFAAEILNLPIFPGLSDEDIEYIAEGILQLLDRTMAKEN